jgi:hypothetical protein
VTASLRLIVGVPLMGFMVSALTTAGQPVDKKGSTLEAAGEG